MVAPTSTNLNNFYGTFTGLSDFLGSQGITQDMWNNYSLAEQRGILDSLNALGSEVNLGQDDGLLGGLNGLLGTNMTGSEALGGAMGLGQLGLGILSYLDQSKTAKKQRQLMGQQIKQNKWLLDEGQKRASEIGRDFGSNKGLAASVMI